jgi:lysophospholipase L1-like esterase
MVAGGRCVLALMVATLLGARAAAAGAPVSCAAFSAVPLAAPAPRFDAHSLERLAAINQAVKTVPHRVLFLGDSLTERWEDREGAEIWRDQVAPLGVLDAGINGDRTEHLSWRLDHGNLDGSAPPAVVLLIGTNDLEHGRPPAVAAEGIRANLLHVRAAYPDAHVLLLGLLPRERLPQAPLRRAVGEVNRLIATCADGGAVVYADIGGVLLEPGGRLSAAISPDRLHFSAAGYARLAPPLDALITRLLVR